MSVQKNSYSLAMVPFVPWAVYNVAEKKGFWDKQNIRVTVEVYTTEDEYVDAVINDKNHFFPLPLASTIDFVNMGKDLVYLGMLDRSNGHKHLILKNSHLNKSLNGETVAIYSEESTTKYTVARYLKTQGLNLADVNLVYLDDKSLADGFIKGDLKLVLAFRGIKERLRTEGDGSTVFTTGDYLDPFGINADRKVLNNIPVSDLIKLYQGRFEALKWIENPDNWEEFKSIVNEVTFKGLPELSDEDVRVQLGEVKVPNTETLLRYNQSNLKSNFDDFKQIIVKNTILDEQYQDLFTFENIVQNQALIDTLKKNL